MILRTGLAWILLVLLTSAVASSKCGTGNVPSYDDIDAVMFTQNGCNGTTQDAEVQALKSPQFPKGWFVSSFDCSTFWVLFWERGQKATTYSQYNLKNSVGTFDLSASLSNAKLLLRKDGFYDLYPRALSITDTARAVLTVKRCAVVTRINLYNIPESIAEQDKPTLKLFNDFRTLIGNAAKKRTADGPTDFGLTGLFDP